MVLVGHAHHNQLFTPLFRPVGGLRPLVHWPILRTSYVRWATPLGHAQWSIGLRPTGPLALCPLAVCLLGLWPIYRTGLWPNRQLAIRPSGHSALWGFGHWLTGPSALCPNGLLALRAMGLSGHSPLWPICPSVYCPLGYWPIGPTAHWAIGPYVHWPRAFGPIGPIGLLGLCPLGLWPYRPIDLRAFGPSVHWPNGHLAFGPFGPLGHLSIGPAGPWAFGPTYRRPAPTALRAYAA